MVLHLGLSIRLARHRARIAAASALPLYACDGLDSLSPEGRCHDHPTPSQVLHAVYHFFSRELADHTQQATNFLADSKPLIGQHDDAAMVDSICQPINVQSGEIADVEGI